MAHYQISTSLGAGGMGEVYRAEDTKLGREVAIKVLPAEVSDSVERLERFGREARAVASLNHPNIVTVHSVEEDDGVHFLTMELVEGPTLTELIPEGGMPTDDLLEMAVQLTDALAAAHDKGIVHRDLKPGNVMVNEDGRVKVLDFGLAKLVGHGSSEDVSESLGEESETATMTLQTRAGTVVGTMPYMSPEQLGGKTIGPASDLFSFGVVLYEMATGRRPFQGNSGPTLISSILTEEPQPVAELSPDLPPVLGDLIQRCLAKDPGARPSGAKEIGAELEALRDQSKLSGVDIPAAVTRGPRWPMIAFAAVVLVAIVGSAILFGGRIKKERWARNEAVPEIERLHSSGDKDGAMRLLNEASEIIPDDPYLVEFMENIGVPVSLDSDPPGAVVKAKGYNHPEREWIILGETPLENVVIAQPARYLVEKEGYAPFEGAPFGGRMTFRLFREDEMPPGMVRVAAGGAGFGAGDSVALEGFWIDTHEVTNREYKAFVDAGGYSEDRFWPAEVDRNIFVDTTGRPGPAGWALEDFPEGKDDLPVGGVSWFEASAYAAWAGKSLPTVFHWRLAAQQSIFSEILLWSNFDTSGPVPVGSSGGIGPNGTYDMAGNVREWCINRNRDTSYILGGAWSEPDYLYRSTDSADPYNRLPINGFRCILTDEPPPEAALIEIEHTVFDHRGDTAIDDEAFALVRQSFDYDDSDLDAVVESTDEGPEYWRHDVVSVSAAYGDERLPIHLYLPKNAEPPYQAVVYFPPSSARYLTNAANPSFPFGYFIPKSGRVLVYPIFQGTYNRQIDASGPNGYRDMLIQIAKDLRRTVDYLETRDDIDSDRLAFYGLSWGGYIGPTLTAIEPRFEASVLVAGGLYEISEDWPPAGTPQNFAPRSTVPTLMINGKADFQAPVETNIQPMFDMLGTPPEHKRLALLEGGHVPASPNEVIREVLDWFDRYLGPVGSAAR